MSEGYDNSTRGTHLITLLYLSFAVSGVSLAAVLYRFPESWMVPILIAGLLVSWYLHISKKLTPAQRLIVYAAVGWLCFLLDGVQPTSMYDISILAALEMLIYSKTDNRKLLHISLLIFFFCLGWQIKLLYSDAGTGIGSLVLSQLASHSFFLVIIYGISLSMMNKRQSDMKADEEEISALKNARRYMEDFLAGISNDLREPVNTAIEVASVVSKNAGNEEEKENAEMVMSAGKRLTNRLNDMLDYMEIDTGRITVSEENYTISSVLNDLITSMELNEQKRLPDILFDVDASIPAVLKGDSRMIRKVLQQAVDNAVKFTKRGGVYVNVYADKRDYGINLSVDVEDTGRGMSRREMERIRTSSYQADAERTRSTGGLGLGFPVMNGIVRMMNGFLTIRSERGKGTGLHITIPQKVVDETPCMEIAHADRIRVAFYQDPSKFSVPAVRDYYARMILHIIRDFKLTMQRVSTEEDLKKLLEEETFTHLFTADEEYSRNSELYESCCDRMHVIVVARNSFVLPEHSGVTVLRKPLYAFPLVELLNAEPKRRG